MADKMKHKKVKAECVRKFSEEAWWLRKCAVYGRETYDSSKKVAISSQAVISLDTMNNVFPNRLVSGFRDNFGPHDLRT
jgi:hypothetical protein